MLSNMQAQAEKLATSQQHLVSEASDARISTLPDVKDMSQRVTYLPQASPSEALTGSLFRNTVSKFYTSIKHMSTPSLLLVVTIAVILVLMQVNLLTDYILARMLYFYTRQNTQHPFVCFPLYDR